MQTLLEFVNHLMNPDWIMANGGLFLVLFIIFAETGLLFGFFLPGDTLLFITGMMIAGVKDNPYPFDSGPMNLVFWITLIVIAAILGNFTGYWLGRKSGGYLLSRKDSWIFKKKHLTTAREFYEKKGGIAIILARFLPILRTFAPVVGGVVKMDFKKFTLYNITGAILWVSGIVTIGYLLGENVWVQESLEYFIIGLILITTAPVLMKMFLGKKKTNKISIAKKMGKVL